MRKLNEEQKYLINAWLFHHNSSEMWIKKVDFSDGYKTTHYSKPTIDMAEIPYQLYQDLKESNDFETFTIKKYNIDGLENLFSKYTKFRSETIQKKFDFLKKYHGEEIETKSKYKTSKIEDFFGKKK